MATITNKIKTVNLSELSGFERIDENLKNLILSFKRTIPGSRGFGIDAAGLDGSPLVTAVNDFAQELDDEIEIFMPQIRIASVDFESKSLGSDVTLKIVVEGNEDYKEG